MTTPTAAAADPGSSLWLDSPHQHTRSCFWDYLECRWHCPPTPVMRLASSVSKSSDASREHVHQMSAERDESSEWEGS
jgi:hypothetical protein